MRRPTVEVGTVVGAAALGLALAVALFFALSSLTQPQAFKDRARAVEEQITRAERLAAGPGDPRAFAPDAVCASSAQGADELKRRIETGAAQTSVAVTGLAVSPARSDEASGQITQIRLQFEASGKYESVVQLLGALSRPMPEIFVDTIDLKPQSAGGAVIKFTGEAFCWSARPRS
jgi:hypothetical protein